MLGTEVILYQYLQLFLQLSVSAREIFIHLFQFLIVRTGEGYHLHGSCCNFVVSDNTSITHNLEKHHYFMCLKTRR